MADNSIRSVAVRNLSCDFMDAVRSVRSRSLSSAMGANLRRLPIVLADETRIHGGRHLDVLGYQLDVRRAGSHDRVRACVPGALTAVRMQIRAQHPCIGDGERADRAETERFGIL